MDLTRSGVLGTVVILLVVVGCIRLGLWQLDRRDQRLTRNAAIAERLTAPPVDLGAPPMDTAGLVHRAATIHGRYDHDRSFVLIGRSHGGAPGVHLFTPLRVDGGAVLVNRGWVPAADAASVDLSALDRPPDTAVAGVLMAFPDVRDGGAASSFRQRWFRLDGDAIRAQYPYPVAPLYLLDTPGAGAGAPVRSSQYGSAPVASTPGSGDRAAVGLRPVPLDPPGLDSGPHLSYAVQWFSFATIFLVGWVVLMLRRGDRGSRARPARG